MCFTVNDDDSLSYAQDSVVLSPRAVLPADMYSKFIAHTALKLEANLFQEERLL